MCFFAIVSRAQKISTVVDNPLSDLYKRVSRAQKISTVVDVKFDILCALFHALKKFLLL